MLHTAEASVRRRRRGSVCYTTEMKWIESVILTMVFLLFVAGVYGMYRMLFDAPFTLPPIKSEETIIRRTTVGEREPVPRPKKLRWVEAAEEAVWDARDSAEVFLFQDKMWLMGGLNGNDTVREDNTIDYWRAPHFNDVWYSDDGAEWHKATPAAEWPPRRSMSVVVFNDVLWMFGGWSPITGYSNDVWSS